MGSNGNSFERIGPSLGNIPAPDSYIRIKQNIDGLWVRLAEAFQEAAAGGPLTKEQLEQIKKALEAGGPNSLNVTGLLGLLLQAQNSLIKEVTSLPASSRDGTVVLYRKVIWRFNGTTHSWSPVSTILLTDFSYNMGNYDPAKYAPGVLYYAKDSDILYVQQDLFLGPTWVILSAGQIANTHAPRTTVYTATCNTNGTAVTGGTFDPIMQGNYVWINGLLYLVKAYVNSGNMTLVQSAGNQNGVALAFEIYPPILYPRRTFFWEVDRTVEYFNNDAVGLVATANNNITWSSGIKFDYYWVGRPIQIQGSNYFVTRVASNTNLFINGDAGNNSNIVYVVDHAAWKYFQGTYRSDTLSRPADLDLLTDANFLFYDQNKTITQRLVSSNAAGYFAYESGIQYGLMAGIPEPRASNATGHLELVDAGYLYAVTDFDHLYKYDGNNWHMVPWDPGSKFIVSAAGNNAPNGGNWAICNGATVTVAMEALSVDGNNNFQTLESVVTPNLTGGVFLRGGTGNNHNQVPANSATWAANAATDRAVTGITIGNDANGNVLVLAGAVPVAPSPHTHNYTEPNAGNGHSHNLSNANSVLNAPDDNNGGLPLRISLNWWMRR